MKTVVLYICNALLICACVKQTDEPTYLNRPMSEWAKQAANDVDHETRLRALLALAHFDLRTATRTTVAALSSMEKNENLAVDERGAAIGLRRWLSPTEITEDEIPLLFSTIRMHPDQLDDWRKLCDFACLALQTDRPHRDQIVAAARELRKKVPDPYFPDEILNQQASSAKIEAEVEAKYKSKKEARLSGYNSPTPSPALTASTQVLTPTPEISEATLTKPIDIHLKYGNATLPSGMKLKILSRNGPTLFADYLGEKIEIPIDVTDVR